MIAPDSGPMIEVPRVLGADKVRFFVENGYLVLDNFLKEKEIQEILADIPKLIRGEYTTEGNFPVLRGDESDAELLAKVLCIHQPHFVSPTMEKYLRHPLICGVLSQITAAHLPHWDGSVKCMQSMLFVKPPGYQGQAWHQDEIYIPTRDRSLIGAWIALDDATKENGCLWIIPGSHRDGFLFPQKGHGNADEFDFSPQSYGFDESKEIPVEVKRGSLVFFNGYLLHRSRKNRSQAHRRVLVNHYMNAWSLLPWHHPKEGESMAMTDYRSVIQVAGRDPYYHKGTLPPERKLWFRACKAAETAVDHAGGVKNSHRP